MKFVYVVIQAWVADGEEDQDVEVFSTFEKAKERFEHLVQVDIKDNYKGCLDNNSPYVFEKEETYWNVWESGFFERNHSSIRIEKTQLDFTQKEKNNEKV